MLSVEEKRTLRSSQDLNLDLLNAMQSEALSKWSSGIKAEDGWCWTQFDSQVGSVCCRLYSVYGKH